MYVENEHGVYVPYYFSRGLGRVNIPEQIPNPQFPQVDWVPTDEDEAVDWGVRQAERWAKPHVQKSVGDARRLIETELSHDIKAALPMSENEAAAWAVDYIYRNGPPKNAQQAASMLRRFLDDQGRAMGIHPAYLAAAELLVDFPLDDPASALRWTADVGVAFAQQYGIPLTTDFDPESLLTTSASAALTQAGVPFAGALLVTGQTLMDGQVTQDELVGLAGMVGSVVGGAVGQMFGLPAPIGAFLGSVVTTLIFEGLGKLFGWGPSAKEKRDAAMARARAAQAAMEAQCAVMAMDAWVEYQKYWHELVSGLEQSVWTQGEWLATGLRYFDHAYIAETEVDPRKCPPRIVTSTKTGPLRIPMLLVEQPDVCMAPLPMAISVDCKVPSGCLYFPQGVQNRGYWVRHDPSGHVTQAPGKFYHVGVKDPDNMPDLEFRNIFPGAKNVDGEVSARAALAFYGAYQFQTPYHAWNTLCGPDFRSPCDRGSRSFGWGMTPGAALYLRQSGFETQSDRTYIDDWISYVPITEGKKPKLGQCQANAWAEALFNSLVQCGPAASLVSRDISATVSAAMVEYRVAQQAQQQSIQQTAAKAAQARLDLLSLRRQKRQRNRSLNGALLGAGGGALAGWAISSMLKR